jgi:hypothetical protein
LPHALADLPHAGRRAIDGGESDTNRIFHAGPALFRLVKDED